MLKAKIAQRFNLALKMIFIVTSIAKRQVGALFIMGSFEKRLGR